MKLKKLFYATTFLALFLSFSMQAQKKNKLVIKPKLVLTYSAADPQGNEVTFPLTIAEMDDKKIKLTYEMSNGNKKIGGGFLISGKGINQGKNLNWEPLNPSTIKTIPDDQTVFCVSRKFFDELKKNKVAKYDGTTFELKKMPKGKEIVVGKQIIDALYIQEKGGKLSYWILNNRDLPFILNREGGKYGPTFKLSKVSK